MSVTYVAASERDGWLATAAARRLDARHAALAVTSIVAVLAISLAYGGRVTADAVRDLSAPAVINLNAVEDPSELESLLRPLYSEPRERSAAVKQLFQFIASRRDAGDRLPNVGALRPLLTREQLAALKPLVIVRTPETHSRQVVV
jgi:hypothetical protein